MASDIYFLFWWLLDLLQLGNSRRMFLCSENTEFRDPGGYKIGVYVTVKERDLQAGTLKLIPREIANVTDSTLHITVR